jgi:hypothetical protein
VALGQGKEGESVILAISFLTLAVVFEGYIIQRCLLRIEKALLNVPTDGGQGPGEPSLKAPEA